MKKIIILFIISLSIKSLSQEKWIQFDFYNSTLFNKITKSYYDADNIVYDDTAKTIYLVILDIDERNGSTIKEWLTKIKYDITEDVIYLLKLECKWPDYELLKEYEPPEISVNEKFYTLCREQCLILGYKGGERKIYDLGDVEVKPQCLNLEQVIATLSIPVIREENT